jgi:dipeptidyl aminopeptidase/acylaminoacyl peptidase
MHDLARIAMGHAFGIRATLVALTSIAALLSAPGIAQATFPGVNGKLAVQVSGPPLEYAIATVNPDGSGFELLTTDSEQAFQPAWSPDGGRLAFVVGRPFRDDAIFVMDASGGNRIQLTGGSNSMFESGPRWSPDGAKLSFNYFQIFVMDADGGDPTVLPISFGGVLGAPDWSPDGTRLAFTAAPFQTICDGDPEDPATECFQGVGPPDIYTSGVDGSNLTALTTDTFNFGASWSPDSRKLAFQRSYQIYVMNSDGTGRTRIGTVSGGGPVWSPDGTKIAFSNLGDIFVMDADGGNVTRVLDGQPSNSSPTYTVSDWQPIPNRPPDCSGVSASPDVLWPPNHKLRPVELSGATDPDGDPVSLAITGVTQDEPVGSAADAVRSAGGVRLRAERDAGGDGRAYRIGFEASDGNNGTCTGTVKVGVPRHGNRAPADSAPPSFDSFGP